MNEVSVDVDVDSEEAVQKLNELKEAADEANESLKRLNETSRELGDTFSNPAQDIEELFDKFWD